MACLDDWFREIMIGSILAMKTIPSFTILVFFDKDCCFSDSADDFNSYGQRDSYKR